MTNYDFFVNKTKMGNFGYCKILGIKIHKVSMNETIQIFDEFIKCGTSHLVSFCNPEIIMIARRKKMVNIMNGFDLVLPDGVGILIASRILGNPIKKRVTGTDAMYKIAELAEKRNYSLYLLGGNPGIGEEAAKKLKEKYPKLIIAGVSHGYYRNEKIVVKKIKKKKPHICMVCLGMYKQEKFIVKHKEYLGIPLIFGNGGALNFASGGKKRAPKWLQDCGLEWLDRLLKEPWRIKRQVILGVFLFLVIKERLKQILTNCIKYITLDKE